MAGIEPKKIAMAGLALLALVLLPLGVSPYIKAFMVTLLMYVVMVQSWNLFSGCTGYVSLGHGLFFGVGAYGFAIAVTTFKAPFWAALLAAGVIAGVVAVVLGSVLLSTKMNVAYFSVLTLGLNEILKAVVANTKELGSSYGITLPPLTNQLIAYYYLLGLALIITILIWQLKRSRHGLALKAVFADEVAAETAGINTLTYKFQTFVVSGIFPGLAGGMIGWYWSYIDPYMAFDLIISFFIMEMVFLGGIGTLFGPVIGAVFMSLAIEILSTNLQNIHPILFGLAVIIVIISCPGGIMELFDKYRARASRKALALPKQEGVS